MSDSVVNKEFRESDIQRMRNLVQKKYGEKTSTQVGFETNHNKHNEGEIFEENGKKWIIVNGLKQSVTKHDVLKKMIHFPLVCPNCLNSMKSTELNKKMYSIHGICLDCVVRNETQLKIKGQYKEYEQKALNQNKNELLEDLSKAITEWAHGGNEDYISEDGEIQTWSGGMNKQQVAADLKDQINKIKSKDI